MLPYYYSLNEYIKEHFGKKMYRLSLDGGMTCPNRDGKLDTRGCIFCSRGGSGDFAASVSIAKTIEADVDSSDTMTLRQKYILENIDQSIELAKEKVKNKYKGNSYIAYFQSFTNTYASANYLEKLFKACLKIEEIEILDIATRPDCLEEDVLKVIDSCNKIKPVWIELGLQTIHEKTAKYIRRGYELDCFIEAVNKLNALNVAIIVHVIIGLPGESKEDIYETIKFLSKLPIQGVKLQLLHVLKGTDLYDDYKEKGFKILTMEEYFEILSNALMLLPKNMVIHRLTGDGPKSLLVEPQWTANKKLVLNSMNKYFMDKCIIQGENFDKY